ncbi:unnamed protein product [Caenorhabditis auriculariae]|uniref:Uncharacterized protein n=1 Tax=Caenorhabditis auriculariae TaxID=2777116 RepID=A0A8S1HAA4_9PELO|nr:unnamed protein product [Caenorhabditis auriculariae]
MGLNGMSGLNGLPGQSGMFGSGSDYRLPGSLNGNFLGQQQNRYPGNSPYGLSSYEIASIISQNPAVLQYILSALQQSGISARTLLVAILSESQSNLGGFNGFSGSGDFFGATEIGSFPGFPGMNGQSGYNGFPGMNGFPGFNELQGMNGLSGFNGISGSSRLPGIGGPSGYNGIPSIRMK